MVPSGAHEVASWLVTGVELLVSILNMMLAFELASGQKLASLMQAWYYLAPVSPIFSMVGAIVAYHDQYRTADQTP